MFLETSTEHNKESWPMEFFFVCGGRQIMSNRNKRIRNVLEGGQCKGQKKKQTRRGGPRRIKTGTFEQRLMGNKATCHVDIMIKFIVEDTGPHYISGRICGSFLLRNLCFSHTYPRQPSDLPTLTFAQAYKVSFFSLLTYILTPSCLGRSISWLAADLSQ